MWARAFVPLSLEGLKYFPFNDRESYFKKTQAKCFEDIVLRIYYILWTLSNSSSVFQVIFKSLIDWLTDWLTGCLFDWLIDWLIGWLIELIDWSIDQLINWSIKLTDWLADLLIDWLVDWFIDSFFFIIHSSIIHNLFILWGLVNSLLVKTVNSVN